MAGRMIAVFFFICILIFINIPKGREAVYASNFDGYDSASSNDMVLDTEPTVRSLGTVRNPEGDSGLDLDNLSSSEDSTAAVESESAATTHNYENDPVVEYGPDANDLSSHARIIFTDDLVCMEYTGAGECVSRLSCNENCLYQDATHGFCMPYLRVPRLPRRAANRNEELERAPYALECVCCFVTEPRVIPN